MASNQQIAADVLAAVGGKGNVEFATHCMTRLRFNLKDESVPKDDEVKSIDGVLGIQRAGGQYQVIIGQNVGDVYAEVCKLADIKEAEAIDENLDEKKPLTLKGIGKAILDYLSGSIVPAVPVIMVAGLFKTIQVILSPTLLGVISETDSLYQLLNIAYNAGFYALPIYLGYIASQKLGVRPVLGMMLGGVLIEPSFVAAVGAGTKLDLFGLPIHMVDYSSSVLPILLSVWIMSYVERFFKRIVPDLFKTILVPFGTMLVMIPLTLVVIAPIGSVLGDFIGNLFYAAGGAGGIVSILALTVLTALQPFLVITGMHMVLVTLALAAFANQGVENFALVANVMSNFAVWAMAFGAFLRLKNKDEKSAALGCFISGLLGGVTEPSLYGIGMKYPRAFIGMVAGGITTGLICAIGHATCYQLGTSSILCLLMFVNPAGGPNFVIALVAGVAGFIVSTIVTFLFGFTKEQIEGTQA